MRFFAQTERIRYDEDDSSVASSNPNRAHSLPVQSEKAQDYARKTWGGELIEIGNPVFGSFGIYEPGVPRRGFWTRRLQIFAALSRNMGEIYSDASKPGSELLNDSILYLTDDFYVSRELRGALRQQDFLNCCRCSACMGPTHGKHCKITKKPPVITWAYEMPLPTKVIDFVKSRGHNFAIDPALAAARERGWRNRR